jgi:NAD(P)-dependent dehydrogenase (short-subunit alcohol dehydrogenase family)
MATIERRTALITGASRGLGLALARELAKQGWNLLIDARGAQALEAAHTELANLAEDSKIVAIPGDVTDVSHRTKLADAARKLGGLDLVVNNASILGPSPQPALLEYPLDVLERVYRTNVIAPLALLQAVQRELKPDACVINITSDAGVEAYEGWGGYGSSKAALEQLSNILVAENPSWRVYWVDPGDMNTAMQQEAFPGEDVSDRPLPEVSVPGFLTLIKGTHPSGRYAARSVTQPD